MRKNINEFREIAHCGSQFTVQVKTNKEGRRGIQFGIQHSRPTPMSMFGIYVLPQGIPVGTIQLGGIGQSWNLPPTKDCLPIFVASDSEGMFGRQCPMCKGYWRLNGAPSRWMMICSYCGLRAETHYFNTKGQLRYIKACCNLALESMYAENDGEFMIDMDEVADKATKDIKKPEFYYTEERQQNKFKCIACGGVNDILGRFGYCSICGTHNGLSELSVDIKDILSKSQSGNRYETCLRDIISCFDSYVRQIAKQFAKRIPMTPKRKQHLESKLFHDLERRARDFRDFFDINIFKNINQEDIDFVKVMFHRRHVYEHNGGEVDERYIKRSRDSTVRVKQVIYESFESVSRTSKIVSQIGQNIHKGFHEIFPVEEKPAQYHSKNKCHKA